MADVITVLMALIAVMPFALMVCGGLYDLFRMFREP